MKKLLFIALFFPFSLQAQKQLVVGDTIPNITLYHLVNYKDSVARLSDFNNQAIVFVFYNSWNTTLGPKIVPFVRMMKLFSDVQPVFVTLETGKRVSASLTSYKSIGVSYISTSEQPGPRSNQQLYDYFPHKEELCYILIDKDRVIRGIRRDGSISKIDIRHLLARENVTDPEPFTASYTPDQRKSEYGWNQNFMVAQMQGNGDFVTKDFKECCIFSGPSWSLEEGKLFGQTAGATMSETFKNTEAKPLFQDRAIRAVNWTPSMMFGLSVRKEVFPETFETLQGKKRYIVEIKDTAKARLVSYDFSRELAHCYLRITATKKTENELYQIMQQDLTNYFGIVGRVERRKMHCYAIQVTDSTLLKTSGAEPSTRNDLYSIKLINQTVERLAQTLRYFNENSKTVDNVIINESNWKGKIDLEIECKMDDPVQVRKALLQHGLDLVEKEALVPVLVMYDVKDLPPIQ